MPGKDTRPFKLTATEKKVLNLIAKGQSNKEIAGSLAVSPFTVKRHVENILRKLGLRNRIEAAVFSALAPARPDEPEKA